MDNDLGALIGREDLPRRVYTFKSWSDFHKSMLRHVIKYDSSAAVMVYGGINDRDVKTRGLIAVHGGINEGNITANYVMCGGGINKGTVWAKKGFWRGGGFFPNVFVGPDREPFDEKTYSNPAKEKIFNNAFRWYGS